MADQSWLFKCKIHGLWIEWAGLGEPWLASPENAKDDRSTAEIMADMVTKRVDLDYRSSPAMGFPAVQIKGIVQGNFEAKEWQENRPASWAKRDEGPEVVY